MPKLLLLLILWAITFTSFSQTAFEKQWNEVEKLELKNLPKSALAVTDSIFHQAKAANNAPQWIKALLYQSKFAKELEEDAQLTIVKRFNQEIQEAEGPTRNILESMLAEIYWQYYQTNQWTIKRRSYTESLVDSVDFRTWDLKNLGLAIHLHYQRSLLEPGLLQQTPLKAYGEILLDEEDHYPFQSSIFDLLTYRALQFYREFEGSQPQAMQKFLIDQPDFFQHATYLPAFKSAFFSPDYESLSLYTKLIKFHQNGENTEALVNAKLERLRFVYEKYTGNAKDSHYEKALTRLYLSYQDQPIGTLVAFHLAKLYDEMGSKYSPEENPEYQFKHKEAFELAQKAIDEFPESLGASFCKNLIGKLTLPELNLTLESFQPLMQEARILVEYRNIDSLAYQVYPFSQKEKETFENYHDKDAKQAYLQKLTAEKLWKVALKNEGDYQAHRMDNLLPGLPGGYHLISVKGQSSSNDSTSTWSYQLIQVTDLTVVQYKQGNDHQLQVINRTNGLPIKGAIVQLAGRQAKADFSDRQKHLSDDMGLIQFQSTANYYGLIAKVQKEDDVAYFDQISTYGQYTSHSRIKTQLFTDRSIYRPGQTAYFKGVVLLLEENKPSVVADQWVKVNLENVNGETVHSQSFKTNEFGSFSGEYILPTVGLTGNYTFIVEEDMTKDNKVFDDHDYEEAYHSISVEEYKRPTFEALFAPVEKAFKVNDSVQVQGSAKAFAGMQVTGAKVTYRVERTVEMPYWYGYWRSSMPRYSSQEIAHGELQTDAEGNFTIPFKAIPDETASPKDQPVFHYIVKAEVTDINGETHEASTTINVGYHSLLLGLSLPSKVEKSDSLFIGLNSSNLNEAFVPAKATVTIFPLLAPNRVLRKSPLSMPDYQRWSKEEFVRIFPHEPYGDESNPIHWPQGAAAAQYKVDTGEERKIHVDEFDQWSTGTYLVVMEAKDKNGQTVKAQRLIQVTDKNADKVADHQLLDISLDKAIYQLGDTVRLKLGSAAEALAVTIMLEKQGKKTKSELVKLQDGYQTISFPIEESDLEGFFIHYSTAFANTTLSGQLKVDVFRPARTLDLKVLTFRDKIQPGSEETWSFHVSGPNKDQVAAEFLASMYDASLDQFLPHQWSFDQGVRPYYSELSVFNSIGVGTSSFRMYMDRYGYYGDISGQIDFSDFDWFGFHFSKSYASYAYYDRIRLKWLQRKSNVETGYDASLEEGYIRGQVVDYYGQPMPGVVIQLSGGQPGTVTDLQGRFVVKGGKGQTMKCSFIGYKPVEFTIPNGKNRIDIAMAEDLTSLEEVVVMGYGVSSKTAMTGAATIEKKEAGIFLTSQAAAPPADMSIRGSNTFDSGHSPLYIVDGTVSPDLPTDSSMILSMEKLDPAKAVAVYGAKGANGVFIITTKSGQAALDAKLEQVKARTNFNETAFFYPHMLTDQAGNIHFSFTAPEALTRWKLQLLGHSKAVDMGYKQLLAVTQKDLMVTPNMPRFLREGDELRISTKISNLSDRLLDGKVLLELSNPINGNPLDSLMGNALSGKSFRADPKGNTEVTWEIHIPENVHAVQYKIVAVAGDFSDGEQKILPVLSKRMLITESMPMWINQQGEKTFEMESLVNVSSSTLSHYNLTLEITSNPVWYAVQALPYLMEYPYECSEQLFSRLYANAVSRFIIDSHPRIKTVFESWKNQSSDALLSNLEKNQELKSLIIQETPWLRNAESESAQKQRIALLFDLNKISHELSLNITKLSNQQMESGGFPWFKGSHHANPYITQHIAVGLAELQQMDIPAAKNEEIDEMLQKSLSYLDNQVLETYKRLQAASKKIAKKEKDKKIADSKIKEFMEQNHLNWIHVQYLYLRSIVGSKGISAPLKEAISYYHSQAIRHWTQFGLREQAMIALISYRQKMGDVHQDILRSLLENSTDHPEMGRYWKSNTSGWRWSQAPVETQALLIRTFGEIPMDKIASEAQQKTIDEMKIWLLKQKQSNSWSNTKATAAAIHALLMEGSDWLAITEPVKVQVGQKILEPETDDTIREEAGTGYYKKSWSGNVIKPEMGKVTLSQPNEAPAWGALYWQYFEDLDKIKSNTSQSFSLTKKLMIKKNTDQGEVYQLVEDQAVIHVGDLVKVRLELKVDRDVSFVHLKDMRAAGFEPLNVLSSYKYQDGLGYYESTRDASTNFFFEQLDKGIYVFEYELRASNAGTFSNGISTIQCMYAPEFTSHTEGITVQIE